MVARWPNPARGALKIGPRLGDDERKIMGLMSLIWGKSYTPFYFRFSSLHQMTTLILKKNLNVKFKISACFARNFNTFSQFYGKINQFLGMKAIFNVSRKF